MINSIQLKNWKSHKESNYEFQPGTNVLVGSMGSGKSSILQAISFALFGTFSELKKRDLKISDIITRTAEQKISEISLSVTSPQNKLFEIKRKIDAKKTTSEGAVRDKDNKLLAGPQTTQVNEFVKKEFGVDDEVFLRTVYAMQNDIDMIIKLAPKDRKKRIDELMGLNKFEVARNNCITFRNRAMREKLDAESFLESIGLENLSKKITDTKNNVEALKSKQLGLQSELSKKKLEKDTARIKVLEFREKLSESNKLGERKRNILRQLSELDEKLKDKQITKSKADLEKEIFELKKKI
ncbi:AAA family ATPase, partial [Candidatus Woesearchaeota archaeon]|nr:AAA family ATPase [Candidatus Woesearchaeota archaeon]